MSSQPVNKNGKAPLVTKGKNVAEFYMGAPKSDFDVPPNCVDELKSKNLAYRWIDIQTLKKNGNIVSNSSSIVAVAKDLPSTIVATFDISCVTAGDYYELLMAGETTGCQILATPAQPAVPESGGFPSSSDGSWRWYAYRPTTTCASQSSTPSPRRWR